jgi:hypothetical protein
MTTDANEAVRHQSTGDPPGAFACRAHSHRDVAPLPQPLRVFQLEPEQQPRWEAYVTRHPDSLIYHHPLWLKVIEQAYGHRPLAFACEDSSGELRGVLPLCHTHGLLTGERLVSLPHTPTAGPLADDQRSMVGLVRAAVEWVERRKGAKLELKLSRASLSSELPFMFAKPWDNTYAVNLPPPSQALRFGDSRNHGRLKWSIQKAAKSGVEARWAESRDDLYRWYKLYLETMRRHAVPPRPYAFFEAAWNLLHPRGLMQLLLAERTAGNHLLAGSIFLPFGRTVSYAFNGWRQADLTLRPNDLIQWTAIHEFQRQGFRRYDLGEVDVDNRGLAEFKLKWGAQPEPLVRTYFPAQASSTRVGNPEELRRLVTAGWRMLPLRTTALLGQWLYRHF